MLSLSFLYPQRTVLAVLSVNGNSKSTTYKKAVSLPPGTTACSGHTVPTLTDADRVYSHTTLPIIKEELALCAKEGQEVLPTLFNEPQLTL